MKLNQFMQSRQSEWKELTNLLDRSQGAMRGLSPEEVKRLGQLYRQASSDLAVSQRDFPREKVTAYLNQLVARSHSVVYRTEPLALKRIWRFVTHGYPRLYRETAVFTLIAALLRILPALLSGFMTNWQPETAVWLLTPGTEPLIAQIEDQELWVDIPIQERPYFSSAITTNNIRVSFLAYGAGVTAGVGTIYVLILNGLLLGSITGLTAHYDIGFELWTFVIGHGVIELSAIFIAGGSGLMLGWAIVQPGLLRRRDALVIAAKKAVRLLLGCVPILIIAGLIEGFISPYETVPVLVMWGVGLGTGLVLYAYLLLAGRGAEERKMRNEN